MKKKDHITADPGRETVRGLADTPGNYFLKRAGRFFLTGLTLGLAGLRCRVREMKYLEEHANVDGYRVRFSGDPREIRGKYLIWNLKTFLSLGYYKHVKDVEFQKWIAANTVLVDGSGKEHACSFDGTPSGWRGTYYRCLCMKFFTNWILCPLASYRKCLYFVPHTLVDGRRLSFDRSPEDVRGQLKRDVWRSFISLDLYFFTIPHRTLSANLAHIRVDSGDGETVPPVPES